MDVTCDATRLSTALHLLAPFLASPALATAAPRHALLLDASGADGPLRCCAATPEMGAEIALAVTPTQPGVTAIPGRPLLTFVREAPEGALRLRTEQERLVASIREASLRLTTLTPTALPRPPVPPHPFLTLPAGTLAALLRRTAFAAAAEAHQGPLRGVFLRVERTTIRLVATNGHRLAYATHTRPPDAPSNGAYDLAVGCVVPRRGAQALQTLLEHLDPGEPAAIGLADRTLVIAGPTTRFHTRLLHDSTYPDYERLLGPSPGPACQVARKALLGALRQATALLPGAWAPVELAPGPDALTITATASGADTARTSIPATWPGEPLTLALNGAYLRDWLETISDETVCLELRGALQPIHCVTPGTPGSGYLLMPIRGRP